jgi:iron complex transport system substrate-binding protein
MEVTDSVGNTMTIASRPQSIISLSLFSDEVLFDLVATDRLAGASSLAADPVYSNVAERAAAVEPRVDFNVEQIIGIYPDIVFAANWSEADKIAQLRNAGIVVYQVNTPFSVEGIVAEIRAVAAVVGEPEAGEAIVSRMRARIDALSDALSGIPDSERASALDYNNWGTANGVDTTWDEVLRLAGVSNAAAPFQSGDFGQVPMSKELLVELDPDVIFLPGYIWGDENGADAFRRQVLDDPAFADLQAVRTESAYMVPENLKGTYSHYLVDAAEFVARLVYPDRF